MKMENKILDERKLVEKIRFSCLIAAILTLYFPSMVHLSIGISTQLIDNFRNVRNPRIMSINPF